MTQSFKDKRPLSPHLQVYKVQITSLLSILHRGTGILLYGGAIIWVLWLAALADGSQSYEKMQSILLHPFGLIVLMGWSLSFFYHLCNGIRHLAWDAGYGYEMQTVRRSGWLVVISSIGLTLVSWTLGVAWGILWT